MEYMSDRDLVGLFGTDREKAFKLFFHQYYTSLCMYAVQITDDFSESEDIVQSFFVAFWEKKLYQSITDNLKGYSYLCIRNASLKFIEKRSKLCAEDIILNDDDYLYVCEGLDENGREQKEKELENALNALPEQERKALYGVVIEDKTYKEVAQELNISVNSLKTYLARAMKKLRKNDKLLLTTLFLMNLR
ncbi:MAG: sigma-70 family RNA polymerase sigma factor [Bacteroides sp.]|nr:sigma-70 family RNA polymerase sigma factor [Bacteroides sp.]